MSVSSFEILSRSPFDGGRQWGSAGPYEVLRGVVRYEVDPKAERSQRICDLPYADTDVDGRVRFDADFVILRPEDRTKANRRLLYVVPNRGRTGPVPFSAGVTPGSTVELEAGDGLLLQSGWTMAWSGWQWDLPRGEGFLGARVPEAKIDGRSIEGTVRLDFRLDSAMADHPLCDSTGTVSFATYTAADVDQPDAVLTMRHSPSGPASTIDRGKWRFARETPDGVLADADSIWLEGGFAPHVMYEVRYRTNRSPIAGVGLLATADFCAFVRYDTSSSNPLAQCIDYAFGTGSSQTGRYLRQFVYEAMNTDEEGRILFDGIYARVAGARRGEFNQRYAQPSHIGYTGLSVMPPFSVDQPRGLYEMQRSLGGVPKSIFTNSSWEYWRGDAALNHIDPITARDRVESNESRVYLFAGMDHSGTNPSKETTPLANRPNQLGHGLLARAAFANLVAWVCEGIAPPESRVPRLAEGTAVRREEVLKAFEGFPDVTLPSVDLLPVTREVDFGPDARVGIAHWPPVEGTELTCYVSAVDADGNEIAGIRLPELRVPVATFTGWNPVPDANRALKEFCGSFLPLPSDPAVAAGTGDPRPSIRDRYADHAAYERAAREAVEVLIADKLLLPLDAGEALGNALGLYDALAG